VLQHCHHLQPSSVHPIGVKQLGFAVMSLVAGDMMDSRPGKPRETNGRQVREDSAAAATQHIKQNVFIDGR
jgi:hypothetical protein